MMHHRLPLFVWLFVLAVLVLDGCEQTPRSPADAGAGRGGTGAMTSEPERDASAPKRDAGDMDAASDEDSGARDAGDVSPQTGGSSRCHNGLRDGDETDIDCGGSRCGTCLSGRRCKADGDCLSGECAEGKCTCAPLTSCPKNACGLVLHCGGELECGACESGVCYANQCCTPRTCAKDDCGFVPDGCGSTILCGGDSCCTPRTCEHPSLAGRCGTYDDRCGGKVSCTCSEAGSSCFLGECCQPKTCDEGDACGAIVSNGCGGTMTCGCGDGKKCHQGTCCTPLDCSAWTGPGCGSMSDGCGGTITCGCTGDDACVGGECCARQSCGDGTSGSPCGAGLSDGCGGSLSCSCAGSLSCHQGQCCQVQTCTQLGRDHRCGSADAGCGTTTFCGCKQTTGMRVEQRNACGSACADTLEKVDTCNASAPLEVLDQTAGWSFNANLLSSNLCNASYGFSPNWSVCHTGFQIDARGFVELSVGTHCFSITGNGTNSCGALYFVANAAAFTGWANLPKSTAATVVTGNAPVCFQIAEAGFYPIRWHYTQNGTNASFRVNYCAGGPTGCAAIASAMLRPALE